MVRVNWSGMDIEIGDDLCLVAALREMRERGSEHGACVRNDALNEAEKALLELDNEHGARLLCCEATDLGDLCRRLAEANPAIRAKVRTFALMPVWADKEPDWDYENASILLEGNEDRLSYDATRVLAIGSRSPWNVRIVEALDEA